MRRPPTKRSGPSKSARKGISLTKRVNLIPDEAGAARSFEEVRWANGVCCVLCQSDRVSPVASRKPLPMRKWAFAICLCATKLKSVFSMKLHRELENGPSSAWFMAHRIREAMADEGGQFSVPFEVYETYVCGKRKNMRQSKRKALAEPGAGRGTASKAFVAGAEDQATGMDSAHFAENTEKAAMQTFARDCTAPVATLYAGGHGSYT